jgi:hypothetical protein
MSVLLENMPMIGLNSFLALIPILFGWLTLKTRQTLLQVAFARNYLASLPLWDKSPKGVECKERIW